MLFLTFRDVTQIVRIPPSSSSRCLPTTLAGSPSKSDQSSLVIREPYGTIMSRRHCWRMWWPQVKRKRALSEAQLKQHKVYILWLLVMTEYTDYLQSIEVPYLTYSSSNSAFFFASLLWCGAPFSGSFFDPASFSYSPP